MPTVSAKAAGQGSASQCDAPRRRALPLVTDGGTEITTRGPQILNFAPLVSQKSPTTLVPPAAAGVLLCLRHFLMDVLQSHHVRVCDAHSKSPLNTQGPQYTGLRDGTRLGRSVQQSGFLTAAAEGLVLVHSDFLGREVTCDKPHVREGRFSPCDPQSN